VIERARLLYLAGRVRAALSVLREGLQAAPNDAALRAFLAMCLKVLGRYAEAERELRQALADDPNYAYTHYVRAALLLARHRSEEAIVAARGAIGLDQSFVSSYEVLSLAQVQLGRWTEALETLQSALAVDPQRASVLVSLATILRKLNRATEAQTAVGSALAQAPEDAGAHAVRGWLLLDEARGAEALDAFREALRLDPYESEARQGLVAALKATNPLYRRLYPVGIVAGAVTLVPALVALVDVRLHAALFAFYGLVVLSYAALVLTLIDASVTVAILRKRFGAASVTKEQRAYAVVTGACVTLNALAFLTWLAEPSPTPFYCAVVVGSFGVLAGAVLALRPGPRREWVVLGVFLFTGSAIAVPLALHDGANFRFADPVDVLAMTMSLIIATWAALGAIAWLRRRG
jgi:tetratricopeptide (TPR) repeat protein